MERDQILPWRPFSIYRLHQFHYPRCNVRVLFGIGLRATVQKQYLVEEVHYTNANRKYHIVHIPVDWIVQWQ